MNIVSNCPLCEKHSLHVTDVTNGVEDMKTLQCVNCGYASANQFLGSKETNESYQALHDDMKEWSKETDGRIWIPSIITLPTGMLHPIKDDEVEIKWAFAQMIDIPEDEQKNYPSDDGKFYKKRFNTEDPILYDTFLEALSDINESAKPPKVTQTDSLVLPTIKKIDG